MWKMFGTLLRALADRLDPRDVVDAPLTGAERMRRHRARRRHAVTERDVTRDAQLSLSLDLQDQSSRGEGERERESGVRLVAAKTELAEGAPLPPDLRAVAERAQVRDPDACWRKFVAFKSGKSIRLLAEWTRWCENERDKGPALRPAADPTDELETRRKRRAADAAFDQKYPRLTRTVPRPPPEALAACGVPRARASR